MYSQPSCQQCKATVRKLDKHEIAHNYIDVSVDEEALALVKSIGYAQAPVVMVHRDGVLVDHWGGFRPDKIEEFAA